MVEALDKISKSIGDPVSKLTSTGDGWYQVVRNNQPLSTRYAIKFKSSAIGYIGYLHDFKNDSTLKITLRSIGDFEVSQSNETQPIKKENKIKSVWESLQPYTTDDHRYLVSHNLQGTFSHLKISNKNLAVPFSPVDQPFRIVGIKYYSNNSKHCEKGSLMRGSVAYHRYTESDLVFVTEGLADALTVLICISEGDVIETGGIGNIRNTLPYLTSNYKEVVLVGENDSITLYQGFVGSSNNIKLVFPPIGKDISDFYQEKGEQETKNVLELSELSQATYRPLGFIGKLIVVYSKTLRSVSEFSLSSPLELLTLGLGVPNVSSLTAGERNRIIDKVVTECSQIGQYSAENERGVGLFKYRGSFIFNAGQKLYSVPSLKTLSFSEVIRDDFLLVAKKQSLREFRSKKYEPSALVEVLSACDWKESFYGEVLCGFLVQALYSGATEFSPHLWIKSNLPKAGKSWLTKWLRDNLCPDAPRHDGSGTTVKGFRQSLRFHSGLTFVDEFAEEDSIYQDATKGIIQTLRSGSTGDTPITLGTKQQIPINIYVKFSALLSCITGQTDIAPQDFERIIFMELKRKVKNTFLKEKLPIFESYSNKYTPEDWTKWCLENFDIYFQLLNKYIMEFSEKKPDLGHKARGFGAILAGYHAFTGDSKRAKQLVDLILESPISEPLEDNSYQPDFWECFLLKLIPKSLTGLDKDYPLHKAIEFGVLQNYGLTTTKKEEHKDKVRLHPPLLRPLIQKYFPHSNPSVILRQFRTSVYFDKKSTQFIGSKPKSVYLFKIPKHLLRSGSNEDDNF